MQKLAYPSPNFCKKSQIKIEIIWVYLELGVVLVLLNLDGFGVLPSGLDQKFLDLVDLLRHVPISK